MRIGKLVVLYGVLEHPAVRVELQRPSTQNTSPVVPRATRKCREMAGLVRKRRPRHPVEERRQDQSACVAKEQKAINHVVAEEKGNTAEERYLVVHLPRLASE